MSTWRPQLYEKLGVVQNINPTTLSNAIAIGKAVIAVDPQLPPIFTLKHLSQLSGVDYRYLRTVVARDDPEPYRFFSIRKRSAGANENSFRLICVPAPELMQVQRWISSRILSRGRPHWASFAYAPGTSIKDAAKLHCGCTWLIKLDVQRFFESISEIAVYRVFLNFGYQPLMAFELTRLCTRLGTLTATRKRAQWQAGGDAYPVISRYQSKRIGHLPQGAPTSPMLSNLAMLALDRDVAKIAEDNGLQYTRYADDIALSTCAKSFRREQAAVIIGLVYRAMARQGLSPNVTKTRVISPGARKIVLGLLVDRGEPRLTREFKSRIRQHIYYLRHAEIGPALHAVHRGFASTYSLKDHVLGLVRFARHVDPKFAQHCEDQLAAVSWPP
ncbi:MAG: reverse transcriptase family protein [Alphaproteobacteria bacterium]